MKRQQNLPEADTDAAALLSATADVALEQLADFTGSLPSYAEHLQAYHEAYAVELREMLAWLPIQSGDRVLDVACGDGSYSCWLAELTRPGGQVTALDIDPAWLKLIAEQVLASDYQDSVVLCHADAGQMPFDSDSFDVVWCAQSLYSLPDIRGALAEMWRVLRPGGIVAILENDTQHHVMFPWPPDLEIEINRAELDAFEQRSGNPGKYYIGRRLSELLKAAGFDHFSERAWSASRQAPLTDSEQRFFELHIKRLRKRLTGRLSGSLRRRFDALTLADSPHYILSQPELTVICIDRLIWGTKPGLNILPG